MRTVFELLFGATNKGHDSTLVVVVVAAAGSFVKGTFCWFLVLPPH